MIVLYIGGINDNRSAGPNINIPQNVFYGSKYAEIGIVNCYETKNNIILKHKNYFSKEKLVNYDVKSLPKPFNNPDIVVFEEVYRTFYVKVAKKLVKYGIPYVITPRGSITFHAQQRKKLKKYFGNLLMFNWFISHARAIHFLTENEYESSKDRPFKNYFVVGNGVEKKDKKKNYNKKSDSFVVTFIGRIEMYHKGLDYLVDSINEGQNEFRKNNFIFNLYGPDDLNSIPKLTQKIMDYNISDLVTINEPVFGKEKEKVLLNSDLFIHTSRLEGQPTAVIEAMSYGIVVFVTPGTNIDKIVEDNHLGFTSEFNVSKIKENLLLAYQKREFFDKISKNELNYIEKELNWDAIMKKTIEEYKKII